MKNNNCKFIYNNKIKKNFTKTWWWWTVEVQEGQCKTRRSKAEENKTQSRTRPCEIGEALEATKQ